MPRPTKQDFAFVLSERGQYIDPKWLSKNLQSQTEPILSHELRSLERWKDEATRIVVDQYSHWSVPALRDSVKIINGRPFPIPIAMLSGDDAKRKKLILGYCVFKGWQLPKARPDEITMAPLNKIGLISTQLSPFLLASDIRSAKLVCKSWTTLTFTNLVIGGVNAIKANFPKIAADITALSIRTPASSLRLELCNKLHTLNIRMFGITPSMRRKIGELIRVNPNLSALIVDSTDGWEKDIEALGQLKTLKCTRLTSLNPLFLSKLRSVETAGFIEEIDYFSNVTSLSTDSILQIHNIASLNCLHRLTLNEVHDSTTLLPLEYSNLTELVLYGYCDAIYNLQLLSLRKLTILTVRKSLHYHAYPSIENLCIIGNTIIHILGNNTMVRSLRLLCYNITGLTADNFPHLEIFNGGITRVLFDNERVSSDFFDYVMMLTLQVPDRVDDNLNYWDEKYYQYYLKHMISPINDVTPGVVVTWIDVRPYIFSDVSQ